MRVAIVGSGIIGLAHALAFVQKGAEVTVFERHATPLGASIRNFGLFWSIGQEKQYLPIVGRSREIWHRLIHEAKIQVQNSGSLILAQSIEEWNVLQEFYQQEHAIRSGLSLITKRETLKSNIVANPDHLVGALKSQSEFSINPRLAIPLIIKLLQEKYGVKFYFNTPISFVGTNCLTSEYQSWESDLIVICSGDDFETLYPEEFREACLEKCHLQMMKARTKVFMQLGSALCSGLSLLHYPSFTECESIKSLRNKLQSDHPELISEGIHLMVAQNEAGELIIGDSHAYDIQPQPFNIERINQLILKYLNRFVNFPDLEIVERWTGTYAVHPEGKQLFNMVDESVWISTGFGGAGMTLGFGMAEKNVADITRELHKHGTAHNYPVAF